MGKILWIRKLSCGHERLTNIAFMCGKFDKPKVKENCFCRQCNENVEIIGVKKAKDSDKKELEKMLGYYKK